MQLNTIHDHILQLQNRADRFNESTIIKTYVNAGPLLSYLSSRNNQILFGRRGTGKTHVLQVLKSKISGSSVIAYIDIRTLGSSASLYNDQSLPMEQRAISLFKDFLDEIYNTLFQYFFRHEKSYSEKDYSSIFECFDSFTSYYADKIVNPIVKSERESQVSLSNTIGIDADINCEGQSLTAGITRTKEKGIRESSVVEGGTQHYINYNAVYQLLDNLLKKLGVTMWVLVDEFSELPTDLQILLADMFRHVFCPNTNIVFKIAAIEYRTLLYRQVDHSYIGLELGADVSSENLDDIMVFGNNELSALTFFRNLLFNHINTSLGESDSFSDTNVMIQTLFTQENVFSELVYAAEGVPRDAINILCEAVKSCYSEKITMSKIRKAANDWYKRDKYNSVSRHPNAAALLSWIINIVIGTRKAKAFLLKVDHQSNLIDYLFDCRILHLIKVSASTGTS